MRTHYVMIDFENVQPESLAGLQQGHIKVLVFVGANQTKVPFEVAHAMQAMGPRAEYIRIAGNGSNALDFHIAFTLGQLASAEPSAVFHIISKDKGFDPLIAYLKSKNITVVREDAIDKIPHAPSDVPKKTDERLQIVLDRLRPPKATRPRTVKTLSSHMNAMFKKQLPANEIDALIRKLSADGHIAVQNGKIVYKL